MRWIPPAMRCSYPSDDRLGVSADQDIHFATLGVSVMGIFAAMLMFFVALGLLPDR